MRILLTLLLLTSALFADEFLYIIHAKKGTFDPKTRDLVLQDIDHSITYFSEKDPKRAGKTTVNSFLFNLLGEDKRFNAGFIYFTNEEQRYTDIPLILSEPHYSFNTDELTFRVKLVSDQDRLPREMTEVNLFVDDVVEQPE